MDQWEAFDNSYNYAMSQGRLLLQEGGDVATAPSQLQLLIVVAMGGGGGGVLSHLKSSPVMHPPPPR